MNRAAQIKLAWKENKPAMYKELKKAGKLNEFADRDGVEMQKRIDDLVASGMFDVEAFEIVAEDFLR